MFPFFDDGESFFCLFWNKKISFWYRTKTWWLLLVTSFSLTSLPKQEKNGHGTIFINKACQTPWVLVERKNTLRKLNLTFECRTDAFLDKKQKKSNGKVLEHIRGFLAWLGFFFFPQTLFFRRLGKFFTGIFFSQGFFFLFFF